ncbi:hypothetical protein [Aliiglaciecola lipolytica]|uniref:hypothetical protein n=1 Tax=Aliiglaciecola lipolytica TaxID=477689 RepID=UPI0013757963|nr:hypothetical protein [Aliiglaciecola lipolytica]
MTNSLIGEKIAYSSVVLEAVTVTGLPVNSRKIVTIHVSKFKPCEFKFIANDNLLSNVSADTNIPGLRGDFELSTSMVYNNIGNSKYNQSLCIEP